MLPTTPSMPTLPKLPQPENALAPMLVRPLLMNMLPGGPLLLNVPSNALAPISSIPPSMTTLIK